MEHELPCTRCAKPTDQSPFRDRSGRVLCSTCARWLYDDRCQHCLTKRDSIAVAVGFFAPRLYPAEHDGQPLCLDCWTAEGYHTIPVSRPLAP